MKTKATSPTITQIVFWRNTAASAPWLIVRVGGDYRAIYWSLKLKIWMVSTVTYSSVLSFQMYRKPDSKISSAGVPLQDAILQGWMPDVLSGDNYWTSTESGIS